MSARSDAWVAAIRANAQQHPAGCTNDCCGVDLGFDHVWEASDPSGFAPDERLEHFSRPRPVTRRRAHPSRAGESA